MPRLPDIQMTGVIHGDLAGRDLAPGRHYLDSGYLSAAVVVAALATRGIALIGPLLADTSARPGPGTDTPARLHRRLRQPDRHLPAGKDLLVLDAVHPKRQAAAVATFAATTAAPARPAPSARPAARDDASSPCCPATSRGPGCRPRRRKTIPFQADYARRAGVEGTMHQAASHGARRARYRGLPKTRLDHAYMAVALNPCSA